MPEEEKYETADISPYPDLPDDEELRAGEDVSRPEVRRPAADDPLYGNPTVLDEAEEGAGPSEVIIWPSNRGDATTHAEKTPVRKENRLLHYRTLQAKSETAWTSIRENVSAIAGEAYILRSERTVEEAGEVDLDEKEARAWEILEKLKNSNFFQSLSEKNKRAVIAEQERRGGVIHALDIIALKEKGEKVDTDDEEYITDRKQREKKEEDFRLRYLWTKRSKLLNWSMSSIFHLVVIINFGICLEESYAIIIEHAKFDRLYLNDDFNCLERVISGDSVNHFFNIIHACTCVAVLFTDQLETASLCWAFVLAQICHACCDTFQFLYNVRFPSEDKTVDTFESVALFMLYIAYLLLSTLIVIHRYYDMTNILQKRTQRFTSSIYSGRLLNEHIIYKNESKFLQKKYTLRQAQALQIYGIVQKIQHFKNRGIKPNPLDIQNDVKLACDMLKNLKNLTGPNLLRELRKRNAKRLKALQDMDSLDEIGVNAQGDRGRRRKERKSKSKKNNNAKISNNENETPTT